MFILIMDNILDTFQISKKNIDKNEKLSQEELEININSNIILKKKKLIEYSKNLTKLEYNEIFSIIEKDNCDYSSNINGIFINLSNVEENTIDKIFNFLKFTKQKKKELNEKEFYIEDFKKNISEEESIKIHKKNSKQKNEYCDDLSSDEEEECTEKYIYFSSDDE